MASRCAGNRSQHQTADIIIRARGDSGQRIMRGRRVRALGVQLPLCVALRAAVAKEIGRAEVDGDANGADKNKALHCVWKFIPKRGREAPAGRRTAFTIGVADKSRLSP